MLPLMRAPGHPLPLTGEGYKDLGRAALGQAALGGCCGWLGGRHAWGHVSGGQAGEGVQAREDFLLKPAGLLDLAETTEEKGVPEITQ